MKKLEARMAVSAFSSDEFPREGAPEIALVGRSNVGKSSLINNLTGRKNLAKTSSTPGKTQRINFYLVENRFYLVDLPGYGYARVPDALKEQWSQLVESYLLTRESLKGIIQVVDFRRPPTVSDREMAEMLRFRAVPFFVVGTKADKVSRGHFKENISQARFSLSLKRDPVVFSAQTAQGSEELINSIFKIINNSEL